MPPLRQGDYCAFFSSPLLTNHPYQQPHISPTTPINNRTYHQPPLSPTTHITNHPYHQPPLSPTTPITTPITNYTYHQPPYCMDLNFIGDILLVHFICGTTTKTHIFVLRILFWQHWLYFLLCKISFRKQNFVYCE